MQMVAAPVRALPGQGRQPLLDVQALRKDLGARMKFKPGDKVLVGDGYCLGATVIGYELVLIPLVEYDKSGEREHVIEDMITKEPESSNG